MAQAALPSLNIVHLTGDAYVYTTYHTLNGTPFPSNSMYLVTDSGVVMIGTPWDTTQFQPLLDSIRIRHHQRVVLCLSTHFHKDRTAGIPFLQAKGIPTYSSTLTRSLCRESGDPQASFVFTGDTTFHVGQYTFQTFFPGEGHTRDNIVVWFPHDKILYGGCLVKSTDADDLGYLADANEHAWAASIKRLEKKYPDSMYVIPGHQGWESTGSLAHTIALLKAAGY
jgi:metallo-beta-lactamase class B